MTTKQIQHLLAYLGYDVTPDGIYGEQTRSATTQFQGDYGGLDPDGIPGQQTQTALQQAVGDGWQRPAEDSTQDGDTSDTGTFWDGIKYFKRSEFACPCGKCGGFPAEPEEKLVKAADKVRDYFGNPMTISSGVRCTARNAAVGGVSNSRHLSGKAMDFSVRGFSASSVLAYVQHLSEIRYAYAIDSNWVHMDIL